MSAGKKRRRIFVKDYASLREAQELGEKVEMTSNLAEADVVVNPGYGQLGWKEVIINLPGEYPLYELLQNGNRVVSRFPIGYGIEVVPYRRVGKRERVKAEDYSCLILNKWILEDIKYSELVNSNRFLLGIDAEVEGHPTMVGRLLMKSKVE